MTSFKIVRNIIDVVKLLLSCGLGLLIILNHVRVVNSESTNEPSAVILLGKISSEKTNRTGIPLSTC